ncbi:MAG: hypothetical protein COX46_04945, partial [bacterium (Candidatus Ratteibacteria) CG23_combo_of_CG06-09_8_20_14_all_48_7]
MKRISLFLFPLLFLVCHSLPAANQFEIPSQIKIVQIEEYPKAASLGDICLIKWEVTGGEVSKTQVHLTYGDIGPLQYLNYTYHGKELSGSPGSYQDTIVIPEPPDSSSYLFFVVNAIVDGKDILSPLLVIPVLSDKEKLLSSGSSNSELILYPNYSQSYIIQQERQIMGSGDGEPPVLTLGSVWAGGPVVKDITTTSPGIGAPYLSESNGRVFYGVQHKLPDGDYWFVGNGLKISSCLTFNIPVAPSGQEIKEAKLYFKGTLPTWYPASWTYFGVEGGESLGMGVFSVTNLLQNKEGQSVTFLGKVVDAYNYFHYEKRPDVAIYPDSYYIQDMYAGGGIFNFAPYVSIQYGPKTIKELEGLGEKCLYPSYNISSTLNLSNGNLYFEQEITKSAGSGLTTSLIISYNSLDSYSGYLGKGFTHNYNLNLQESADSITFMAEDGERIVYQEEGGVYKPEPRFGDSSQITKTTDGYFLTIKYGTKYYFNIEGKLTKIEDRNNNTQTFAYTDDNLTEITDSSGRSTTLAYADGKLTGITDPAGNTTTLQYTADNLTRVIDPGINTTTYTYDEDNRLISKTDPNGNTITYTYDEEGRVNIAKLNEESPTTISYDPTNNKAVVTDSKGSLATYTYDPELNTQTKLEDGQGNITNYAFDEHRNLVSTIDQIGNTSTYTYDTQGNLLTLTDPQSNTTTYTYEPTYNQIASITDPQQNTTSYAYDVKGNLTAITDSNNQTTSYSYDQKGNLVSTVNPNGQATSFDYDQYGNLTKITDNSGNVTCFTYDASGNMLSRTDADRNVFLFEYNALNQLTKTIDPKNNCTFFTYDGNGNRISIIDALGNTTRYEYNARNQLIKVIDAKGGITGYTYDT